MNIVLFGPLGWKKNVWNTFINLLDEQTGDNCTYTFFEFPKIDKTPDVYEMEIAHTLQNMNFDYIIANSYGVNFFLHIVSKYQLSFVKTQIILIDGVIDMESADLIQYIQKTRSEHFPSFEVFCQALLGESYSEFELELVQAVYDFESNKPIFTNADFCRWIEYVHSSFMRYDIEKVRKQIPGIIIFAQKDVWCDVLDVREFIQLKDTEHLLMVENPKRIVNVLYKKINTA